MWKRGRGGGVVMRTRCTEEKEEEAGGERGVEIGEERKQRKR